MITYINVENNFFGKAIYNVVLNKPHYKLHTLSASTHLHIIVSYLLNTEKETIGKYVHHS